MNIKIAVPENPVFSKLFGNHKNLQGIDLIKASEQKLSELMLNSRVDVVLLNPLSYSAGMQKANYRIIPATALFTQDYTSIASLYFNSGLGTLKSCAVVNPEEFIVAAGKILLKETYGISVEMKRIPGNLNEMLEKADSALVWDKNSDSDSALDLSEEWYMSFEYPLPLGFWVCRENEVPQNIVEIINSIAAAELPDDEEIISDTDGVNNLEPRIGKLIYRWNENLEDSLEQTLQLLYYHQYLPEIPAIKVLGKEIT